MARNRAGAGLGFVGGWSRHVSHGERMPRMPRMQPLARTRRVLWARNGHACRMIVSLASGEEARQAAAERAAIRNGDSDSVVVVTGASRGLGLAFVQQLASRFKGKIVAGCRSPVDAPALNALWQFNPLRLTIEALDVTEEASVQRFAERVREFGNGRVDVLINCAGLLHDQQNGVMPERSLSALDPQIMELNFRVNAVGPALMSKHISPMMVTTRKQGRVFSVIANLSARVGSIGDNGLGGWHSYRMSKAAQNQLTRTASHELGKRGIVVIAMHPGTCDTDLSMPFQRNVKPEKLFAPDFAVTQLLDLIDALEASDNGHFFAYDRTPIVW
ncbi:putative oxidoreductase [Porphyridium purpureum]|uniref:Putative oxidoreductase n=1 Tax=Porphyridium purpureum TaxID=35688 RepID=A0A5J4YR07_PORPP|nr:putative oxidoreductase [Porphyridium purpureum]|eukprot:POR9477..scf222_8